MGLVKRYSIQQILNILAEMQDIESSMLSVCQKYGITDRTLLGWQQQYAGYIRSPETSSRVQ